MGLGLEHDKYDYGAFFAQGVRTEIVPAKQTVTSFLGGKRDEAETVARNLLIRYPDVQDGRYRLGTVHEARGDKKRAASLTRLTSRIC